MREGVVPLKAFVLHTGWRFKPKVCPYLLYLTEESPQEHILPLEPGAPLTIKVAANEPKFCIGFTDDEGRHRPCKDVAIIPRNRMQCQTCSSQEFFSCRAYCLGDFCHPSSEAARVHCWETKASVYLTYLCGKVKVGSSTSPLRRWVDQGSDAGIVIAEGVGLDPRALERRIATKFSLPLSVRLSQKLKYLGVPVSRATITTALESIIEKVYTEISSPILLPRASLHPITFLDEYYGAISSLSTRPIIKTLEPASSFSLSGEVVGVKGSILVLRNKGSYFSFYLPSLIGFHVQLSRDISVMAGQKSLFDFI